MNPPRLMNIGTSDIHARKCPRWSFFWYRTWVKVTALRGGWSIALAGEDELDLFGSRENVVQVRKFGKGEEN
ncbi:hypothetical protein M5689_015858 [Euphorbia peplus]|nr:hypothetical protein M5689_015858 [Euphorbia peplus]